MKHKLFIAAFSMLFLAGVAMADAAKFNLNYGSTATPNSLRGIAEEMFLKEIETVSEGQIAFNRSWGGALVNNQEVLQAVQDGVIDVGQVNPNFYPKQLLLNNAFSLIMQLPVDYNRRLKFFDDCFAAVPQLEQEIQKFNQKLVYNYNVTNYTFVSTSPITKVEDLKGMKIRAAARWLLSLLKEVGATPVSMPLSDAPMAFQTNALNAGMLSVDATDMQGMLEVAPYALVVNEFPVSTPYYMTMNSATYAKLPKELQDKIPVAAANAREKFSKFYNEKRQSILEKWSKNPRYHVTVAGPEFIKGWTTLAGNKTNFETWVKEAKDAGLANSREVLEGIYKVVNDSIAAEESAKK